LKNNNNDLRDIENHKYPKEIEIQDTFNILQSLNYKDMKLPLKFLNDTDQLYIESQADKKVKQDSHLKKILKVAAGTAIIGTALSYVGNWLKRIHVPGRIRRINSIVSQRNQQLQLSVLNTDNILKEYHTNLYNTAVSTYLVMTSNIENQALRLQLDQLNAKISISISENRILRQGNIQLAGTLKRLDRLQGEIISKEYKILMLERDVNRYRVLYKDEVREHLNLIKERNNHMMYKNEKIRVLKNELKKARSELFYMEEKIKEYQSDILNIHTYYKERDSEAVKEHLKTIFSNTQPRNISQTKFEQMQQNKKLYDYIYGALIGATSTGIYNGIKNSTLKEKLESFSTDLTIKDQENIDMSTYLDSIMKKASFNDYISTIRKNKLLQDIKDYENENKRLKSTNEFLTRQIFENKENERKMLEAGEYLSDVLYEASKREKLLEMQLSLFKESVEGISHIQILQNDFTGFKDFVKKLGSEPDNQLYVYALSAYRKVYLKDKNYNPKSNKIKGYINLLDYLTQNNALDNIFLLLNSRNGDEFIRNANIDINGGVLDSLILKSPENNPVFKIRDEKTKMESFLSYLGDFFERNSLETFVGLSIVSIFMISATPVHIFHYIKGMAGFLAKFLFNMFKEEVTIKLYQTIIDAVIWALKKIYQKGKHVSSILFAYISKIIGGDYEASKDQITINDPMIEYIAFYVEKATEGNIPSDITGVTLPFDISNIERAKYGKVADFDDIVNNFLDRMGSEAKNIVSTVKRKSINILFGSDL